jgi:hypothetical protein
MYVYVIHKQSKSAPSKNEGSGAGKVSSLEPKKGCQILWFFSQCNQFMVKEETRIRIPRQNGDTHPIFKAISPSQRVIRRDNRKDSGVKKRTQPMR